MPICRFTIMGKETQYLCYESLKCVLNHEKMCFFLKSDTQKK